MELDLDVMNADEVLKDLFERGGFGAYKYVRVGGNYRFISVGSNPLPRYSFPRKRCVRL